MAPASLCPVGGTLAEVERLLRDWLDADRPPPIGVRTSGSTGEPKDVLLSQSAIRHSATATAARLGGPGQWLQALPVHYVAGLQVVVRSLLAGTRPVVLADHATLDDAVRTMGPGRRYAALVPTQLYRYLAAPSDARALACLDAVLLGGSAARPDLLHAAAVAGIRVVTTYGMTETCGGCVYDGRPLDGVEVDVGPDGGIRLRGPVLFDGYDGRPDLTADTLRDGWLHTPDLGRLVAGRLEVLARRDDVVVSGGTNVPLTVVRERLLQHPRLAEAVVVGVPDDEWGTRVVAVVVPAPATGGAEPSLEELRDFVSAVHPRSWAPRELVVRDHLPMLAAGKVDRQAVLRTLAATRA